MSAKAPGGQGAIFKRGNDIINKWLVVEAPPEDDDVGAAGPGSAASSQQATFTLNPPPQPAPTLWSSSVQRVSQVALGAEHGVLLTDAGVCFTWGDNRYGQLGRRPVQKEENNEPFPVMDLLNHELLQIASGKHHCLARTVKGLVYAWGRNKQGQLGCGDLRDKTLPVPVRLEQKMDTNRDGHEIAKLLGGVCRIISIGAGMNSSVAVDEQSGVYQWGGISSEFREVAESKGPSTSEKRSFHVLKYYPYQVMRSSDFRTTFRTKPVSITEGACAVRAAAPKGDDHSDRIKKLVMDIISHKGDVAKRREELLTFEEQLKADKPTSSGEADVSEANNLADTISTIDREMLALKKDIELFDKNLHSCNAQQSHQRKQLQDLQDLTTKLSAQEDDLQVKLSNGQAKKGSSEARQLEKKLQDIREFMEANQNTRMILLDQRAETDKDKQYLQQLLMMKKRELEEKARRLKLVQDLAKPVTDEEGRGAHSILAQLRKHKDELARFFDSAELTANISRSTSAGGAFVYRKRLEEKDYITLDAVENKIREMPGQFEGTEKSENVGRVVDILEELVRLRRSWTKTIIDKDFSEDQNMTMFFKGGKQPATGQKSGKESQFETSSKLAIV
mmetsp:Transcript_27931/g.64902  ORF Transcript_27931/g.64902 Transcript_27931/m.64902 type:complete len:619 (-) Transcript_27931:62-1918(-)